MTSPTIVRIPSLPLRIVNAHVVLGADGALLVDAGLPGTERKIEQALRRAGLGWRDLALIVLTHAHVDHAGAAAAVRARSGAPVVAHRAEVPFLAGDAPMEFCPTGRVGRVFARLPLIHEWYAPIAPDVVLEDGAALDLAPFGFSGTVRHAGGHTRGSLVVELGARDALVGDLLASGVLIGGMGRVHRPIRPPFEDDPARVSDELTGLLERGARRFHLGHGGPLGHEAVGRHVTALRTAAVGRAIAQRPKA